jgi:hypothetical protein
VSGNVTKLSRGYLSAALSSSLRKPQGNARSKETILTHIHSNDSEFLIGDLVPVGTDE